MEACLCHIYSTHNSLVNRIHICKIYYFLLLLDEKRGKNMSYFLDNICRSMQLTYFFFLRIWKIHLLPLWAEAKSERSLSFAYLFSLEGGESYPVKSQCSPYIGTIYLICMTLQFIRFFMMFHFLTCLCH